MWGYTLVCTFEKNLGFTRGKTGWGDLGGFARYPLADKLKGGVCGWDPSKPGVCGIIVD